MTTSPPPPSLSPVTKVLSQLPSASAIPDEVSVGAGISGCEKGSQWQMAACFGITSAH